MAVFEVVRDLTLATALRLADRLRHRLRDHVGVHDDLALDVARRATDRLNQRRAAAEIAFLIGIEDADERYLRQVETFAQEIDADEHVEEPAP